MKTILSTSGMPLRTGLRAGNCTPAQVTTCNVASKACYRACQHAPFFNACLSDCTTAYGNCLAACGGTRRVV